MTNTTMGSCLTRMLVPLALLLATACSELTNVDAPDVTEPSSLANAEGALVHRTGAIAQFAKGFAAQALFTGLMSDELGDRDGGNLNADQRKVTPAQDGRYPYLALSTSRINSLIAIEDLQQYAPTPAWRIGELFAYVGYAELFFAENMCSGVPLGTVVDGTPDNGPALTRSALIAQALAHFDSAAQYAADNDSITNLIRIARGRALLDSGDVAAAAAAVDDVPRSYRFDILYSTDALQTNTVYAYVGQQKIATVSEREGINGLDFVSADDPRVPTQNIGPGATSGDVYTFLPYSSLASPIVLASGVEAALIKAEAELAADHVNEWANTLNTLRQTAITPAIPALTADSTTTASPALREIVMFRERAFWMFGTGHRHGDLRRLVRQYGRDVETVFPTGLYQSSGLLYGPDVTFVPSGEEANPAFSGCIDRDP